MKTRILSSIIGLCLLAFVLWSGGLMIDIAIVGLIIIALYEMKTALAKKGMHINFVLNLATTFAMMLCVRFEEYELCYKMIPIVVAINVVLFVFKRDESLTDLMANIFVVVYIILFFFHLTFFESLTYFAIIPITAWGSDTFAYFTGCRFGKNKLCPHLSPKKTVEGALGGIAGSLILVVLYALIFKIDNMLFVILAGIFGAIAGQIGDLVASKIKRICDIKDFGYIMPGHGGVLDRFDSILLTTPVIYFLYSLLILN